jgi:hypothetical protein
MQNDTGGSNASRAIYGVNVSVGADFTLDWIQNYTADNAGNRVTFRFAADTLALNSDGLDQFATGNYYTLQVSNAASSIRRCIDPGGIVTVDSGDGHGAGTGLKVGRMRVTYDEIEDEMRIRVYSGTTLLIDYVDTAPPEGLGNLFAFQVERAGFSAHSIGEFTITQGDLGAPV